MKSILPFLLFITNTCSAQNWQAELMVGVTGYNGDLTQKEVLFARMRPAASLKLIYNSGDFVNFRIGVGYGKIQGDDKTNTSVDLRNRNLSFQSTILEMNVCAEFNLFDPEIYNSYPYIFAGVGMFHFDPYAYDNNNQKVYLHPLSTEGQGLKEYPDRKPYSLFQFCLPVGLGWKIRHGKWEFGYEIGYRILFTDYLDDISKNFVSLETLTLNKGPKAAEMSFRNQAVGFLEGEVRGDPKVKDTYFFAGLRFAKTLGKGKKKKKENKDMTDKKEETEHK